MGPSLIRADLNGVLVPAVIKGRNGEVRPKTVGLPSETRGEDTDRGTKSVLRLAFPCVRCKQGESALFTVPWGDPADPAE